MSKFNGIDIQKEDQPIPFPNIKPLIVKETIATLNDLTVRTVFIQICMYAPSMAKFQQYLIHN